MTTPSPPKKPYVFTFTPRNTLAEKHGSPVRFRPSPETSDLGDSTGLFDSSGLDHPQNLVNMVRQPEVSGDASRNTQNPNHERSSTTSGNPPALDQENQHQKAALFSLGNEYQKNQSTNATTQHAVPEFGKASPLRNSLTANPNSIFNVPKPGAARPEHHRPVQRQPSGGPPPTFRIPGQAPVSILSGPSAPSFQPALNLPPPPPRLQFSAMGTSSFRPINVAGNISAPRQVIDLTAPHDPDDQFDPDAALRDNRFGAPDPFQYVDAAQANENIKALLEGAFDESDQEQGAKRRRLPRRAKKVVDKAKDVGKSLAEKLHVLDVKESEKKEPDADDEDEDDGTVDGLNVKLLPHQIEGVAWMLDKESGKKKKNGVLPKGGILADDMGLGKTIQSMSLILMNPRPSNAELEKDKKNKIPLECSKTTLVVAPLALIRQWESEIKTKSSSLKVLVHHGASRTKSARDLIKADVVVTTYQTLTSEHAASSDYEGGPKIGCFGAHWYRIILDEAHSIKNRNAKSTQACYALQSVYRWCLTGTPMQNNLDELQSLIRFLNIKPYCELSVWKQQITNPMKNGRGGLAMRRLQYFLKACMKRRTKDVLKKEGALMSGGQAHAEGFKIVDRNVKTVVADFGHHERKFYNRLETRAQDSLEEMMSGAKADYIGALVLLLRLRQACNHPDLMRVKMDKDKDALATGSTTDRSVQKGKTEDKEVDDIADLLGGLSVQTKKCDVCQVKLSNTELQKGLIRCEACEQDIDEEESAMRSSRKDKKNKKKEKSKSSDEKKKLAAARRRVITDSDDEDQAEGTRDHRSGVSDPGVHSDDENEEGGGDWIGDNDSVTGDEDEEESSEEESGSEEDSALRNESVNSGDLVSSTKIDHLLDILEKETPEHKVIVFSQFTSMLDLIEPFLNSEGFKFVRYDGSMRNDAREASLNKLRTDKRTRVLLCSLKCGSLGLNLTAASRVVLMEPFWNPFVEEQAIDRVHRLNQTKDVTIYRLTIADTVEERILTLQEAKRALATAALEGGKSVAKLSMQDILALFRHDAEHKYGVDVPGSGVVTADKVKVLNGGSGQRTPVPGVSAPRERVASGSGHKREEHPLYGRRY